MELNIPPFIEFEDKTWAAAELMTVAHWRRAQQSAVERNDKHTLYQFRAATMLLKEAERLGFGDDDWLMARLGMAEPPPAPKPKLSLVQ